MACSPPRPPNTAEPRDIFVYDPETPVLAPGGSAALSGPMNQAQLEAGNNLLVYTGSPLDAPLHILGSPKLTLYCVTSAAHADLTGKLIRLRPGGQADFVCIGIARSSYLFRESGYHADAVYCWQIELEPTSCVFAAGDAIRLEVASSAFPLLRQESIHRSAALAGGFLELAALYPDAAARRGASLPAGTSSGDPVMLTLSKVSKRYGNSPPVLEQIDLTIAKGEFVSLIGPSGCGKSTLLKLISGLTGASSGTVLVDGTTPVNARRTISYIFQDATLLPWRTVTRNVGLGLELEHVSREARMAKVQSLLELVGLTHVARSYPRQLSGGMKMRVSVARALATTPRLLLMDEPFGALDEMTRDRLNEELLRLRAEQDWTAVFVTHSVAEAVFLSTRIIVLAPSPGRIAQEITINLPYPRTSVTRESPEFESFVTQVSRALRGVHSA